MADIPPLKSHLLKDRVILITGASTGIGRAAAYAYAAEGATVILLARTLPQLESLYDEIIACGCATPALYPLNLANATPNDYEELMKNIETHFGKLDGILHNAALLKSLTPLEHYPIDQWYQVLQVNLNSAFLLTQATLPLLKRSQDASILFTSAPVGQKAKAYWGAYAVSKFGVEGLAQVLADELEVNTNIRVNCIDPMRVRTRLRANAYPAENPMLNPLAEDILSLYLYLMGPNSRGITGQRFQVTESVSVTDAV